MACANNIGKIPVSGHSWSIRLAPKASGIGNNMLTRYKVSQRLSGDSGPFSPSMQDYLHGVRGAHSKSTLPLSANASMKQGYRRGEKERLVYEQQAVLAELCKAHGLPCTPLAIDYLKRKSKVV